jgi:hypothetical protein
MSCLRSNTNFKRMAFCFPIQFLLPPHDRRMIEKRGRPEEIPVRLNEGQG